MSGFVFLLGMTVVVPIIVMWSLYSAYESTELTLFDKKRMGYFISILFITVQIVNVSLISIELNKSVKTFVDNNITTIDSKILQYEIDELLKERYIANYKKGQQ